MSLASSWKIHSSRDDESILQDLNSAFDLLKRICEEDPGWNADVRLLVSTDPSLFGSLCGYPPSSK